MELVDPTDQGSLLGGVGRLRRPSPARPRHRCHLPRPGERPSDRAQNRRRGLARPPGALQPRAWCSRGGRRGAWHFEGSSGRKGDVSGLEVRAGVEGPPRTVSCSPLTPHRRRQPAVGGRGQAHPAHEEHCGRLCRGLSPAAPGAPCTPGLPCPGPGASKRDPSQQHRPGACERRRPHPAQGRQVREPPESRPGLPPATGPPAPPATPTQAAGPRRRGGVLGPRTRQDSGKAFG